MVGPSTLRRVWAAEVGVRKGQTMLSTVQWTTCPRTLAFTKVQGNSLEILSKKVKRKEALALEGAMTTECLGLRLRGLSAWTPDGGQSLHSGWGPRLSDRVLCDKTFPEKPQTQVYSPQMGNP